ncbi:MAG: hypothetical protein ABSE56_14120 [Bryobacteraceae bacterium]
MDIRLGVPTGLLKALGFAAVVIAAYFLNERKRRRAIAAGAIPKQDALRCPACGLMLEKPFLGHTVWCPQCWRSYRYSSLLPAAPRAIDLETPPPGARLERLADGFTIAVSMHSELAILTVLCGLFVLVAGGCLLAAGMQTPPPGRAPVFGPLVLLAIPVLSAAAAALCLVPVAGQLRITRHGDRLTVFTGVGTVGWTSEYRWSSFETVYEEDRSSPEGRDTRIIVLDGERRVTFGGILTDERRDFVLHALRAMLAEKQATAALSAPLS